MMPSLGDKQGQIEQKQRAREEAIRLMGNVAGSGNQLLTQNQMPTNLVNPSVPNNPATSPAKVATPPMYATNGKTRIVSTDGGNTWQPAGGQ